MSIHTTFAKQSMINRLSNPINRNRSAAKILKVMSSITDTLNMCQVCLLQMKNSIFTFTFSLFLQGVWVFIIFVCKKNVLKVVTRKSNSLYNTIAKQMSSKSHHSSPSLSLSTKRFVLIQCMIISSLSSTIAASQVSEGERDG